MADYVINEAGTATQVYPSSVRSGDTWTFNVTNTNADTAYTGTILRCLVPVDCSVQVEAYGARGAYGNLYSSGLTSATRSGNGAYVFGEFAFSKGEELLLLVGQHGKDATTGPTGAQDQTTGAGGGGTFVVKRSHAPTGYTMVGNTINGSDAYAGWHLTPLIIAAGGNGSRDNGYSGTGTIYGGLHTTGTAPTYAAYSGGGFSGAFGTVSANASGNSYGLSFLYGGLGSQYYYTRTTYAKAGFGGGGANYDDGAGGGGGGYYGGLRESRAAQSYNIGEYAGGASDHHAGDGLIRFTFLRVPGAKLRIRYAGSWLESDAVYAKQNGLWVSASGLYIKQNGAWKESV